MHARLGIDPRQADQAVRTTVTLPHGTGSTVRVLVFAQGEAARIARKKPAPTMSAPTSWSQKINDGWVDFDAAIATADMMGKVGTLGRVLGRRGLMPNPRSGTVVRISGRSSQCDQRSQGRTRRVPQRPPGHRPYGHRQEALHRRGAAERICSPSSTRSTAPSQPASRAST